MCDNSTKKVKRRNSYSGIYTEMDQATHVDTNKIISVLH